MKGIFLIAAVLSQAILSEGTAYPSMDFRKSIQPDGWNSNDISGNGGGGVAVNFLWSTWEATLKVSESCTDNEYYFDGHCFVIDAYADAAVQKYYVAGLQITGVLYGSPSWAREDMGSLCGDTSPDGYEIFCAPDDPTDFGRFTGMIAQRYNGSSAGRVIDFVIWNEVNAYPWFNIGCGDGVPCDAATWINRYAALFNSAYDAITAQQPEVKILASFEHSFDASLDNPSSQTSPLLSVMTFISKLVPAIGNRILRIAYHPYAPDLFSPNFSASDYPLVTYGNIGVLVGWLAQTFPDLAATWGEIQCTESGISSAAPQSDTALQATAVCQGLENLLGTPFIHNYVYHRMIDNENEGGLLLGFIDTNFAYKPAWSTWALANNPLSLSCGYELIDPASGAQLTKLTRFYSSQKGIHWTSSRMPPSGFVIEHDEWRLLRSGVSGTTLLWECAVGSGNLITDQINCEGLSPRGPVGYIYTESNNNTIALYRCYIASTNDHFLSTDAGCEGAATERLMGYACLVGAPCV